MALSPGDPSSYARPDHVKTTHIHLDWDLDFDKKILSGECILSMEKVDNGVSCVLLDCRTISVSSVIYEPTGENLTFKIDGETSFGSRMEIQLPSGSEKTFKLILKYSTSPECSALQWLSKEQTAGGTQPYVFSQCQAIHARSMLPCQDTPSVKASYSASVTAPLGITVLMSGIRKSDETAEIWNGKKKFKFEQPIPVQSYLIAIAAGAIVSKKIGPRSHVWAEEAFIEKAAFDFADTEAMLKTAEDLCGPYVWGEYDILILPPSFPFGGMENPCLTFATPSLLSGDKSNADVIAHEIAHSWTGNLVTNCNFEHFWLNEGFTVFVERKILGRLHGEPYRHLSGILRWKQLDECVNETFGPESPFTKLVVDLKGIDPDDAFSVIPYEKGATFLWYLEELVGGADQFEPFLRAYFEKFKPKSISTDDFKEFFIEYFSNVEAIKDIDWATWLYVSGMPPYKPKFDESLVLECYSLAENWRNWNPDYPCTFTGSEIKSFSSAQIREFLNSLLVGSALLPAVVEKMENLYKLSESCNMEILFSWIRVGIAARWEAAVPLAVKLVTDIGRMKFLRPLYRDLYAWEAKRQVALDTYTANKNQMIAVCRDMLAKDLHISQ
ncbi:leukotriene A-4 hydrolase isoform X2 [Eurytemora carolleeae]|uniref:leukotriene A-4 hydrolase isoform X2 n=1 Tax=Eurytemora carolleeae TaxID=1294199 RepID=UPI000C7753FE|nr:leukotriene A-4 hydrolase isoform X2 [Eurytemora carolleeae]|eukprot:XP_023336732.1 leukotriene A-4 hydrolase-like isoform X2 [Eurytemora affinis]